jgi:hypothetical protein
MKNIHVLPTDNKPSRLYLTTHEYIFEKGYALSTDECQNKNIFITSDEKFNRDEYVTDGVEVIKATPKLVDAQGLVDRRDWKKIILTTDQDLIKDGVQAIDDEFLEWFVKNPSCEEVDILIEKRTWKEINWIFYYKIIIPRNAQQVIDEDFGGGLEMGQIIPKEEPFKHKVEAIPAEEILANRSNAYEFIDFDKNAKTYLVNHYIAPFLLKNGFKGSGGDSYYNSKCTVNVLEDCHQIDFNHPEYGKVSTYTDSHSIMHLVGTLTWNDLIDKNYKK